LLGALREERDTGPEAAALLKKVARAVEAFRAQFVADLLISGPTVNDAGA